MRVAVIDLGTFSAVLLIAEIQRGRLTAIHEERRTVDLAYSANRVIGPKSIERARRAILTYFRSAETRKADAGLIVATAAIRHAKNRQSVVRLLREASPFPVRILTARDEARFGARGALLGLTKTARESLIVDVGGGSTELIDSRSDEFVGIKIGASWATNEWAGNCPRSPALRDLYFLLAAERATVGLNAQAFSKTARVVALGGTITTLAAVHKKLKAFDVNAVHGTTLNADWIAAIAAELSCMPQKTIRSLVPFDPSRAKVLTAGTYLWSAVLNRLNVDHVTVSARGLRWGVAAHLAGMP